MITAIIAAAARDALDLADGGAFFEETDATRAARAERTLQKAYPTSLRAYMVDVSAAQFVQDMDAIMSLLATSSVMAYGRKAGKHRFLKACAGALKEVWASGEVPMHTQLGAALQELLKHRGTTRDARVAEREVQQFVELALKEDSPHIQIADALEKPAYEQFQELYGGIPSFQIRRQLLGGSRLFVKGKLVDMSWRAKVQTFLSALK